MVIVRIYSGYQWILYGCIVDTCSSHWLRGSGHVIIPVMSGFTLFFFFSFSAGVKKSTWFTLARCDAPPSLLWISWRNPNQNPQAEWSARRPPHRDPNVCGTIGWILGRGWSATGNGETAMGEVGPSSPWWFQWDFCGGKSSTYITGVNSPTTTSCGMNHQVPYMVASENFRVAPVLILSNGMFQI